MKEIRSTSVWIAHSIHIPSNYVFLKLTPLTKVLNHPPFMTKLLQNYVLTMQILDGTCKWLG